MGGFDSLVKVSERAGISLPDLAGSITYELLMRRNAIDGHLSEPEAAVAVCLIRRLAAHLVARELTSGPLTFGQALAFVAPVVCKDERELVAANYVLRSWCDGTLRLDILELSERYIGCLTTKNNETRQNRDSPA